MISGRQAKGAALTTNNDGTRRRSEEGDSPIYHGSLYYLYNLKGNLEN